MKNSRHWIFARRVFADHDKCGLCLRMLYSRLRRRRLLFSLGLVIAAHFIGAALVEGAESPKKLRLAYAGWEIGTAVAYIGVDAGLFKQQGIEVEELPIRDTLSAGVQSLLGVDVLIGFGNPLAVLQPVAGGDCILIGAHVSFDQYGMGVGSAISELKQLKGKKIGVAALGCSFGSRRARACFGAPVSIRPRTSRWSPRDCRRLGRWRCRKI